jgi:hypothetical protein
MKHRLFVSCVTFFKPVSKINMPNSNETYIYNSMNKLQSLFLVSELDSRFQSESCFPLNTQPFQPHAVQEVPS